METIKGIVKGIIFTSHKDNYNVLMLEAENIGEPVKVCGYMGDIYVGCTLVMKGKWTNHYKHGRQFQVEHYKETPPNTKEGLKSFLCHGPFSGIGPICAENIVNYFGEKTLEIIDKEPQRLTDVLGIGEKRAEEIISSWTRNKELKELMEFSTKYDIRFEVLQKIYAECEEGTITEIMQNPYQLIGEIRGISFAKADSIALQLGVSKESLPRCCAGVLHVLTEDTHKGNSFMDKDTLIDNCAGQPHTG